jgi:DNA mismatch endonuclease (patch repair protein)
MSDVFTKAKRSAVMSRIRGAGNKDTELALIKILRSSRIKGWRRNSLVFGKPDFIFPIQRVAVFVDGCFWHGCPRCYRQPKSNVDFWKRKISGNKKRDLRVCRELKKRGWRVVRIWEHSLVKYSEVCVRRIKTALDRIAKK